MVRRWRLVAQVFLIGAIGLVFPSAGSALSSVFVALTANGPSLPVLTIPAGMDPYWVNTDQVTHTVVFANGLCSFQLAPGAYDHCPFAFNVGQYPYTVDGTIEASVVVNSLPPTTVTLTAKSHTLHRAARLRLHGTLDWIYCCGPPLGSPLRVPIVLLARPDRHHPFQHLATVRSETRTPDNTSGWRWRLNLHPKAKTIYIAKVTYQPTGEQGQRQAWSKPFKVLVRR